MSVKCLEDWPLVYIIVSCIKNRFYGFCHRCLHERVASFEAQPEGIANRCKIFIFFGKCCY